MAVRVFILFLIPIFLRGASGADASGAAIDIQPIDPRVREGDDVILNCFGGVEGAAVHWYQIDESYSMFQSIERNSFPGGRSLRLLNASRLRGEDTSSTSFACVDSGTGRSRRTAVTVVPRSAPGSLQSSLVVSPANLVAQNGSSITLTCIDPSENETDIGWYVSKVEAMKFASHEVDKFENGAFLRIVDISVESAEEEISVVCLQSGMTAVLTKSVTIRLTAIARTTEATGSPERRVTSSVGAVSAPETTTLDCAGTDTAGDLITLILIAIATGTFLAVFCVCIIVLLLYSRSRSYFCFVRDSTKDAIITTSTPMDIIHSYNSVPGHGDGDSDGGGAAGKSGNTDLTHYEDVAGEAGNRTYLKVYEEPTMHQISTDDGCENNDGGGTDEKSGNTDLYHHDCVVEEEGKKVNCTVYETPKVCMTGADGADAEITPGFEVSTHSYQNVRGGRSGRRPAGAGRWSGNNTSPNTKN